VSGRSRTLRRSGFTGGRSGNRGWVRASQVAKRAGVDDGFSGPFVREVDPVVEAVERRVDPMLRVRHRKARDQHLAVIGLAVAVSILEIEDVGSGCDDDAAPPAHDAGRQHQPIGEHGALVGTSVAVCVFEQLHASRGSGVHGIARHLQNEPAAVLVDVHGDRRLDVRLGRHQIDAEARVEPESRQRVGWRVRRAGGRRRLGEGGQREQDGGDTAHGRKSYYGRPGE
jgi:hypothetical protein